MDAILVFITAGCEEEAARISTALLDNRLVACVNQLAGVNSNYWWKGAREHAEEVLLMAKTRRELWPQVLEVTRRLHSYEVFEAIAVPVVEADPDYLRWIWESTREP